MKIFNSQYEDPHFWSNIIGEAVLYKVMMGCGNIYEDTNGVIHLNLPSQTHKLACGCAAGDHFTLDAQNQLVHVHGQNMANVKQVFRFQGPDYDQFWEEHYLKYPWNRPITI